MSRYDTIQHTDGTLCITRRGAGKDNHYCKKSQCHWKTLSDLDRNSKNGDGCRCQHSFCFLLFFSRKRFDVQALLDLHTGSWGHCQDGQPMLTSRRENHRAAREGNISSSERGTLSVSPFTNSGCPLYCPEETARTAKCPVPSFKCHSSSVTE